MTRDLPLGRVGPVKDQLLRDPPDRMRSSLRIWGHALMRGIRMDLLSSRCQQQHAHTNLHASGEPAVRDAEPLCG